MVDEITAKSEGSYTPAPEGDDQAAVCCDIIDLGMIENKTFGKIQHKAALVFQLATVNPETGKRFEVAKRFTVSMHEKASLRAFLGLWRGRSYTEAEAKDGAPLHKLEGVPAVLTIEHNTVATGKTYANIFAIRKAGRGDPIIKIDGYVRSEHWKKAQTPEPVASNGGHPDDEEDETPF